MPTLVTEWEKLSAQLDKQDAAVLQRIANAYGESYARINPKIDALIEYIETHENLTKTQLSNSSALRELMNAVIEELDTFEGYLRTEVTTATNAAARAGLSGGTLLMLAAFADAFGVDIADIPRDTVKQADYDAVLAFLDEYVTGLSGRIDMLSNFHSMQIRELILDGVAQGLNPRTIARMITDQYGMGLTDSMRMTRTAQLYAYRQANNQTQIANADVLQGVVWHANLDSRTCLSCIQLHGTIFPVGTLCNDHHNGRCTMLPLVIGVENDIRPGEEWFTQQSEATQKAMMGEAKWQAWQDGKFSFDQLSRTYNDDVFGEMRSEASLKSLVGE